MRIGWLVIALVVGAPIAAVADPAEADRLAADAATLAKAGDFVGAAAKFRDAYKADPQPKLICNIGIAYQKAKDQLQ